MGVRPGQVQPAARDLRVMTATSRTKYLAEMTQLSEQFAELAEALRPVAGETDTMIVPVSLLRRLTNFVERGLPELREVACYIPNEVLEGVSRPAIPPRAETYDPRFCLLESHAAAEHRFHDADEAVDELRQLIFGDRPQRSCHDRRNGCHAKVPRLRRL
jgi:hypothetical protein